MSVLLDLCYLALLGLLSPALLWISVRTGKYRQGLPQKLWGQLPLRIGAEPCVWFHAVSVGEVNLLATLIQQFERERPDVRCFITTTTKAGFELANQKYPLHAVDYCPLDFSWAVRRAMSRIRPSLLVLVELEIWPNLIQAARRADVPVAMVNGRMSERSFRGYHRIRWVMKFVFAKFSKLAVQNSIYRERFVRLGSRRSEVSVTGSIKFDGAETERGNLQTRCLRELAGLGEQDRVFLAGSTLDGEERLALDTYQTLVGDYPELRLIIVPRHPERFDEVAALLDNSGLAWMRRKNLDPNSNSDVRVLMVDTVGELGAWWGVAEMAFVGGSMADRGGQNMIEPAAYGAAVSFGPNTANFRDVVQQLLSAEAATVVHDQAELTEFVRGCLRDPREAKQMGQRAQELVRANLGATERTFELLDDLLPVTKSSGRASSRGEPPFLPRKSA
ncbi:MAG: 3-deoxy-D-manno-octulosonic acid transferase [Pirellulaceae bacterium]|nr:3-deoxy-D-manno-octulosonic acid transferase [Pirellulaceae bacterium]